MDPNLRGEQLKNSQPGMPKPFRMLPSSASTEDEASAWDGLAARMDRALSQSIMVDKRMLSPPKSVQDLMARIGGKVPCSVFRLLSQEDDERGWRAAIYSFVTPELIERLVHLFLAGSREERVKCLFVLNALWTTELFEEYLKATLSATCDTGAATRHASVVQLYALTCALAFEFDARARACNELFPYGIAYQKRLTLLFGVDAERMAHSIVCAYYIRIIHYMLISARSTDEFHKLKVHLTRFNQIHQNRVVMAGDAEEFTLSRFINVTCFSLVSHPRSGMCALGVFLLVQLRSSRNGHLGRFMRDTFNMLPALLLTCRYRYKHTKWVMSHLMKLLIAEPWMTNYTMPLYAIEWVRDAVTRDPIDQHHLRFRFAYEYAHTILREGIEFSSSRIRPNSLWESPVRNSHVLRHLTFAIHDLEFPLAQLRALQTFRILTVPEWTGPKNISMGLCRQLRERNLPWRVSFSSEIDEPPPVQRVLHGGKLKKKSPWLEARRALAKAPPSSSYQLPPGTPLGNLSTLPQDTIMRIFSLLEPEDLISLSTCCMATYFLIEHPRSPLWASSCGAPPNEPNPKAAALQHVRSRLPRALYDTIQCSFGHLTNQTQDDDTTYALHRDLLVHACKALRVVHKSDVWWPEVKAQLDSQWLPLLFQLGTHGASLEVTRAAWRVIYQLPVYHTGLIETWIKEGTLKQVFSLVSPASHLNVIFVAVFYFKKWIANEDVSRGRRRMARKDVTLLVKWIRDSSIWGQMDALYRFVLDDESRRFAFPSIANFFATIHDSFLAKPLKKALYKQPDYASSISAVRDMFRSKSSSQPNSPAVSRKRFTLRGQKSAKKRISPTQPPSPAHSAVLREFTVSGVRVHIEKGSVNGRMDLSDVKPGRLRRRKSDSDVDVEGEKVPGRLKRAQSDAGPQSPPQQPQDGS